MRLEKRVRSLSLLSALAALTLSLAGASGTASPHDRLTAKHNYNHHVRPILMKHCAQCHSPGGIAPMSLMQYDDATPWAAAIRAQVLDRTMPPFLPEEGTGDFTGAHYLTAKEIEAIVDWATGGTPQGDAVKIDPVSLPEPAWTLGTPDQVLQVPAVVLGSNVSEITKCTLIAVEQRNLVIRAIEFQPGNREVVHSAELTTSPECNRNTMPLATWLPGDSVSTSPNGHAWTVTWGKQLFLRVLYRKTWRHDGKELRDQSKVALYYAVPLANAVQSVRINGSFVADEALKLTAIFADEAQRVELDGKPILEIARFDDAWNAKLVFREPISVKKGARITGNAWIEFVSVDE